MKWILVPLMFVAAQPSMAMALACLGEAQLIARVKGVQLLGFETCFVEIDPATVTFYQPNGTCPLALPEIIQSGIEVGVRSEDVCNMAAGDPVNGLVVKDHRGQLTLE